MNKRIFVREKVSQVVGDTYPYTLSYFNEINKEGGDPFTLSFTMQFPDETKEIGNQTNLSYTDEGFWSDHATF